MKRRVVITGLGVVTSLAAKVELLWERLLAGQSGIHQLKLFDVSQYKVRIGGDVWDWNPAPYIDHREAKRLDRFSQFAIVAAADAVEQCGIDFSKEDSYRCGAILGSGIGGINEIEEQMENLMTKGPNRVSAFTIPRMMLNAAGGNLSIKYGLRGPNYTVATACASANNAMGDAYKTIAYDEADVIITGGAEAAITKMGLSAFQNMKALSDRNEAPEKASRPFDAGRDGFVFSEGAGILIFEEYEHAKKRGATILAEVVGYGISSDAGHITQPDEYGAGAARAMEGALKESKLRPDQVDYINAHGTSTPLGDAAETQAIKTVFGEHAKKVAISSTKSSLGHSLGASGGIELVVTTVALNRGIVPPTINLDDPDPACDLDYTPNVPKERKIRAAMSNSFGFGGHNASLLIAAAS